MKRGPCMRPLADRFWEKVTKTDKCWLWVGSKTNTGYGTIWVNEHNRKELAHRAAWFLETGEWPIAQVLHKCDTPACVRHDHHFQGTQADNSGDMWRKGRGKGWSYNRLKTHCPQGHPYSEGNLYVRTNGQRACRECGRIRQRLPNANHHRTKTYCKRGHKLSPQNVYSRVVTPADPKRQQYIQRNCRLCQHLRGKKEMVAA